MVRASSTQPFSVLLCFEANRERIDTEHIYLLPVQSVDLFAHGDTETLPFLDYLLELLQLYRERRDTRPESIQLYLRRVHHLD
jgi:hypothetical protein